MKRSMKLFERLLDTDVKADLLTLFHNNAHMADTSEGLAKRVGRSATEVQRELEDLVELGILRRTEVYSFGVDRDKEIQDAISKQLALGELPESIQTEASKPTAAQIPKMPTGLKILDKMLPDGLPAVSTLLILSDPGSGEENILTHFVAQQLERDRPIAYVTLDNFPANIRQAVQIRVSKDTPDWSLLVFVDCYSRTVGVESEEEQTVEPDNLTGINIALSDIMGKKAVSLIVLNSFNTLIRKRGAHSAIEFLRVLVARTRQARCLSLVTMNRKAFHPAIVASAQDVADGVIELKVEEGESGSGLSLRVLKMVGAKHLNTWTPYEISEDGSLIDAGSNAAE
jgi:KaiC/GvpD/RAD55 family RecA-like ATPase